MSKILIVSEAGEANPSGKIRAGIYRDCFKNHCDEVRFKSYSEPRILLFAISSSLIARLSRLVGFTRLLMAIDSRVIRPFNRFFIPHLCKRYDVVYLQKVLSWRQVEKISEISSARLVYDLNDGVWLPLWSDSIKRTELEKILSNVDAVTCDNPFGIEFAREYNRECHLVPDSPQVERFDARRGHVARDTQDLVVGWVGSPSTLFNLYAVFEALEEVFERHQNIHLRLIGTGFDRSLLPCFEKVRFSVKPFYTQDELIDEVLRMDIGIFPLFDLENSRARGVLKATIYMSGGAAVVASAVGQCTQLIVDGQNGMLASGNREWVDKLSALISSAELRKKVSEQGVETVRNGFALSKNFELLRRVLVGQSA